MAANKAVAGKLASQTFIMTGLIASALFLFSFGGGYAHANDTGSGGQAGRDIGDDIPTDLAAEYPWLFESGDSNGEPEFTPVGWASLLGLMVLNYWLAKRRGRNGWRWFFGTLLLLFLATIYLLVTKPRYEVLERKKMSLDARAHRALLQEIRAINGVGERTADKVAAEFPTRAALCQASRSRLEAIHGLGEKQASLIQEHFREVSG